LIALRLFRRAHYRYEDIIGLGDYALIINDSSVVQDVAHNPLAVELLKRDVKWSVPSTDQ
jgi:hypothetical protein